MPRIFEAPPGFVLNPDYLVPELRAQRDALLEALREYRAAILFAQDKQALMSAIKSADDKARAAIAKAEGEKA